MKGLSIFIITISFFLLIYATIESIDIAQRTQVGTDDGIYTSYITTSPEIKQRALFLTKDTTDKLYQIQLLLNFVTDITYQTETFQRSLPKQTIEQNFGDCDDKSNLLISLLHALGIESYFVLVPHHIFIIVPLYDDRISYKKGLWIGGRKYYILETTAKNSKIGFPLHYRLSQIDTILEPFSNTKLDIESLEWR
ncbi:MAG: transglutaminase domain-containing protein [Sulfurovum sp.]